MGFLRRLFGPTQAPQPSPRGQHLQAPIFDRAASKVPVVGESIYQAALELVAGGRTEDGPRRRNHIAVLIPEPMNPYDPNAIMVQIDARQVGHLSRQDAIAYGPVLQRAAAMGFPAVGCHASLTGGWDRGSGDRGNFGVMLHLGSPAELLAELGAGRPEVAAPAPLGGSSSHVAEQPVATEIPAKERRDLRSPSLPAGHRHLIQGPPVDVVGESQYRDAIENSVGRRAEGHQDIVDAVMVREPENRYDPNAIAVQVGGQTCGYLARADAVRYLPVMEWCRSEGFVPVVRGDINGGWRDPDGTWADFGFASTLPRRASSWVAACRRRRAITPGPAS